MSSSKPMFKYQSQLPKLPVPSLQETLATYVQSVKPHLSESEFERTKKAVADFAAPNGPGQILQKRLEERDASVNTSWLIDWWNDYAYMGYRDPVVVFVSYFYVFKDDPLVKEPAARAASIIQAAMQFRDLVINEQLEPDATKTNPLCMHQYRFMFNSTRIPQIPSDTTKLADPFKNNHIVVIRKNQFYILNLEKKLSTREIESALLKIYKDKQDPNEPAVGSLTSENRDTWTKARQNLLKISSKNKNNLDLIERAAFCVCLDDTKPVTREEASTACWHGDGKNRFFDKSLQFIIFDNGKAGFNGEHSMMDATPTDRMCNWILESLDQNKIDHGTNSSEIVDPVKLKFDLDWELKESIKTAQLNFAKLTSKEELQVVAFEGYGKSLIKKFKLSPDAYAQMAIQLAYYKMYGQVAPTYESAQTKKFAYGRTETCRSCTVESAEWVKAMQDPSISLEQKGLLGRRAIASQSQYMQKAIEARGCDRHLLGLKMLVKPTEPLPTLYTDPAYARTCHWKLSTSQITSEYYDGYGWGQVVDDGYGIAYMVKNESMHFNLVSLKLNNLHLKHYFYQALDEMRQAFEATVELKPKL